MTTKRVQHIDRLAFIADITKSYTFGELQDSITVYDLEDGRYNQPNLKEQVMWGKSEDLYKDFSFQLLSFGDEDDDGNKSVIDTYNLVGMNWNKILNLISFFYNSYIVDKIEEYSPRKQKGVLADALIKKALKIDKNEFIFTNANFTNFEPDNFSSVSFRETMYALSNDGFISIKNVVINIDNPIPELWKYRPVYLFNVALKTPLNKGKNPYSTIAKNKEKKLGIYISAEEGLYRKLSNKKLSYPISGRRAKLVWLLKEGVIPGPQLTKTLIITTAQILSQEIERINNKFKENLKTREPLIIKVPTGGYKLNSELDLHFI